MNDLFVPYNIAKKLKEKNFDGFGLGYYYDEDTLVLSHHVHSPFRQDNGSPKGCIAPLYQQVINWFRDKRKIKIFESQYYTDRGIIWYVKEYQKSIKFYSLDDAIDYALTLD